MPPPWTSNAMPRWSSAIAVHSMCHPGRPWPNGGLPRRFVRSLLQPQQAVERVALARPVRVAAAFGEDRPASARDQVGDAAEPWIRATGRSRGRRRLRRRRRWRCSCVHQLDDPRDGLDRTDVVVRRETRSAVMSSRNSAVSRSGQLRPVLTCGDGPLQQRVVDVGDVLDVVDVVAGVTPGPVHQVERDVGGGVAEVGGVVRGDAADVHPRRRPRAGGDHLLPTRCRTAAAGALGRARGARRARARLPRPPP